jgi:hypothetical protein
MTLHHTPTNFTILILIFNFNFTMVSKTLPNIQLCEIQHLLFGKFIHSVGETKPYQKRKTDKGRYRHYNRLNEPIKLQKFSLLADSHGCNLCTPVDVNGPSFINFVVVCADYFETVLTVQST